MGFRFDVLHVGARHRAAAAARARTANGLMSRRNLRIDDPHINNEPRRK